MALACSRNKKCHWSEHSGGWRVGGECDVSQRGQPCRPGQIESLVIGLHSPHGAYIQAQTSLPLDFRLAHGTCFDAWDVASMTQAET